MLTICIVHFGGGCWYFNELHPGLKNRVFYDPLMAEKDPVSEETVPQPSKTIKAYFSPMGKKFEDMEGDKTMTTVYQHFFSTDVPSSATEAGVTGTNFEDATMKVNIPLSAPARFGLSNSNSHDRRIWQSGGSGRGCRFVDSACTIPLGLANPNRHLRRIWQV